MEILAQNLEIKVREYRLVNNNTGCAMDGVWSLQILQMANVGPKILGTRALFRPLLIRGCSFLECSRASSNFLPPRREVSWEGIRIQRSLQRNEAYLNPGGPIKLALDVPQNLQVFASGPIFWSPHLQTIAKPGRRKKTRRFMLLQDPLIVVMLGPITIAGTSSEAKVSFKRS